MISRFPLRAFSPRRRPRQGWAKGLGGMRGRTSGTGGGVVPALRGVAAGRAQPVGLVRGLHALGRDGEPERVAEVDEAGREVLVQRVAVRPADPGDELRGQLQLVQRQPAQVRVVGLAGAEVVDGDPQPGVGERPQRGQRRVLGLDDRGLQQLQLQPVRRQPGRGRACATTSATSPGSRSWPAARLTLISGGSWSAGPRPRLRRRRRRAPAGPAARSGRSPRRRR